MKRNFVEAMGVLCLSLGVAFTVKVGSQIKPDEAFLVQFEGIEEVNFRLWCNGSIVKNYSKEEVRLGRSATKTSDGFYTYTLSAPPLTLSQHTCYVSQYTDANTEDFRNELKTDAVPIVPECRLTQVVKK